MLAIANDSKLCVQLMHNNTTKMHVVSFHYHFTIISYHLPNLHARAGKPAALCSLAAANAECALKTPCSPTPTATALLPCKSTPKVKKIIYDITENDDFDREMIPTYEEVARLYPRPGLVRPIVLVGAPGVGRNELRRRLIATDPEKYVTPIPCKIFIKPVLYCNFFRYFIYSM